MSRNIRLHGKELYHHIYAWGNDRHPIFKIDEHYKAYISYLKEYSVFYFVDIIAYALMQWHIHLFIHDRANKISAFMKALHGRYAQYYNRVNDRTGHVFGKRFSNKIVQGDTYGMWLSRYIHRQAMEAGIVKNPVQYPWSSYHVYIGMKKRGFICPEVVLSRFGEGTKAFTNYRAFVLSIDTGPIDWAETKSNIVGEVHIVNSNKAIENNKLDNDKIMEHISQDLRLSIDILKRPSGWRERRLRHTVVRVLRNKYRKSVSEISVMLDISNAAVIKIMKK